MVPWSTKETKENIHTKGSIKIKNCLLVIDDDNIATITELTEHDKIRLRNRDKGITRIITQYGNDLRQTLQQSNIKHGPIRSVGGACSRTFYITDIMKQSHVSILMLNMSNTDIRILKENEGYYKLYDDPKYKLADFIDTDELYEEDDDEGDYDAQGRNDGTIQAVPTVQSTTHSVFRRWTNIQNKIVSIRKSVARFIRNY